MDVVVPLLVVVASMIAGYGIRAIQHPTQKRAANGRFTKE